jgi:hypothetical protein
MAMMVGVWSGHSANTRSYRWHFMNTLTEELMNKLPWLVQELNFQVVRDWDDPEHFDNGFVTLKSPAFYLRFIRDRGEIFAELASHAASEEWWDLHWISELLPGEDYPVPDWHSVGRLLRSNFSLLMEWFGPKYDETKRELRRREQQRKHDGLTQFGK